MNGKLNGLNWVIVGCLMAFNSALADGPPDGADSVTVETALDADLAAFARAVARNDGVEVQASPEVTVAGDQFSNRSYALGLAFAPVLPAAIDSIACLTEQRRGWSGRPLPIEASAKNDYDAECLKREANRRYCIAQANIYAQMGMREQVAALFAAPPCRADEAERQLFTAEQCDMRDDRRADVCTELEGK